MFLVKFAARKRWDNCACQPSHERTRNFKQLNTNRRHTQVDFGRTPKLQRVLAWTSQPACAPGLSLISSSSMLSQPRPALMRRRGTRDHLPTQRSVNYPQRPHVAFFMTALSSHVFRPIMGSRNVEWYSQKVFTLSCHVPGCYICDGIEWRNWMCLMMLARLKPSVSRAVRPNWCHSCTLALNWWGALRVSAFSLLERVLTGQGDQTGEILQVRGFFYQGCDLRVFWESQTLVPLNSWTSNTQIILLLSKIRKSRSTSHLKLVARMRLTFRKKSIFRCGTT